MTMLDIKWIRENPEALDEALAKRGAESRCRRPKRKSVT
jgi:seryl-tRNA synthetase